MITYPNENRKNKYLNRCKIRGVSPNQDYLKMFDDLEASRVAYENSVDFSKNNLEHDLRTTEWIVNKIRGDRKYAQHIYAALCNNQFFKLSEDEPTRVLEILKDDHQMWSCSWRYAGEILSNIVGHGDYMDWYCSGSEGMITNEVKEDLQKLNWFPDENNQDPIF